MEGKSPASNSLNIANVQESDDFDSVLVESAKCVKGVDSEEWGLTWKRARWTDEMAKLLITAASYIEDPAFTHGTSTCLFKHKIGKWKVISTALVQRGFKVSPQQCENKFNDLYRKYKRLNTLLANGVSCEVVKNPALVGMLNPPSQVKEEISRILRSKQLLFKELVSYQLKSRLFLPHNRELERQLMMIVKAENGYGRNVELEKAAEANDGGKPTKRAKVEFQPLDGDVKGKSAVVWSYNSSAKE